LLPLAVLSPVALVTLPLLALEPLSRWVPPRVEPSEAPGLGAALEALPPAVFSRRRQPEARAATQALLPRTPARRGQGKRRKRRARAEAPAQESL
jgi:hypothetical protein